MFTNRPATHGVQPPGGAIEAGTLAHGTRGGTRMTIAHRVVGRRMATKRTSRKRRRAIPVTPRWVGPLAAAVAVLVWPVAFMVIFALTVGDDDRTRQATPRAFFVVWPVLLWTVATWAFATWVERNGRRDGAISRSEERPGCAVAPDCLLRWGLLVAVPIIGLVAAVRFSILSYRWGYARGAMLGTAPRCFTSLRSLLVILIPGLALGVPASPVAWFLVLIGDAELNLYMGP